MDVKKNNMMYSNTIIRKLQLKKCSNKWDYLMMILECTF